MPPVSDKAVPDKPATDRPATDRPATVRPATNGPATVRPVENRPPDRPDAPHLSVIPLDYDAQLGVITYFHSRTDEQLDLMGCARDCLPDLSVWRDMLFAEASLPLRERSHYYAGWYVDGQLIGHANINDAVYGDTAFVHMHMWDASMTGKGYGPKLLALSLRHFFCMFRLNRIMCEPKADNPGPNGALRRLGLGISRSYETTPGPMHQFQRVNRYEITPEDVNLRPEREADNA